RDFHVTGVQTCALPILKKGAIITGIAAYGVDTLLVATMKDGLFYLIKGNFVPKPTSMDSRFSTNRISSIRFLGNDLFAVSMYPRSEERRVGKECRSRWS